MTRITLTFLLVLCIVSISFGQNRKKKVQQRFKAGLIAGANLAQINGDLYTGYDKLGLQFGVKGIMVLTPQREASIELLYSQRGSERDNKGHQVLDRNVNIHLTYAETPILMTLLYKENEEGNFFHNHFHFGLSYSRLLNTKIEAGPIFDPELEVDYAALAPFFKTNDLAVVVGITHFLSKHLGFTIRHTVSLTRMFENDGVDTTGRTGRWHSFFFTGQVVYLF